MSSQAIAVELYWAEVSDEVVKDLYVRSLQPKTAYSCLYNLLLKVGRNKKVCMSCAKTWAWYRETGVPSIENEYNKRGIN